MSAARTTTTIRMIFHFFESFHGGDATDWRLELASRLRRDILLPVSFPGRLNARPLDSRITKGQQICFRL